LISNIVDPSIETFKHILVLLIPYKLHLVNIFPTVVLAEASYFMPTLLKLETLLKEN